MKMRRMRLLAAPVTVTQPVRLLAPEERYTERAHIGAMPHVAGEALGIRDRDAAGRADGVERLWERHSEASTTTIISPSHDDAPFVACPGASDALDWLEAAPGRVIRATRIAIVADEAAAAAVLPGLGFAPSAVVSRSEEHTSELQSLMRISYAVFCLKKQKETHIQQAH